MGKHDGIVDNKRYFQAKEKSAAFLEKPAFLDKFTFIEKDY